MNEPSTRVAERPAFTQPAFAQPAFAQPAFTQQGRKGIAYDWQSLFTDDELVTEFVTREDRSFSLAFAHS